MFAQRLKLTLERDGRFAIPGGLVVPYMGERSVSYMNQYSSGHIEVGPGDLELVYRLPQRDGWIYEGVSISALNKEQFVYDLWNERDGVWEPVEGDVIDLTGERLEAAVAEDGTLRLRLASRIGGTLVYPELTAKGRVER